MTVLRNRDFALFWSAGVVNALGDYVFQAAAPARVAVSPAPVPHVVEPYPLFTEPDDVEDALAL